MNKRIVLNLIGQLSSFVCTLGINFVLTPYIVKMLGHEAYGFVGLAGNFINYVTLITVTLNGMLSRYITLEYAKKEYDEASGYFSTAIVTQLILALLLVIPMMILAVKVDSFVNISPEIVPDVRILWVLLFGSFLMSLPTGAFGVASFARNRLEISAVIGIISHVLRAGILVVAFVFFPPHVWYMGLAGIAVNIFSIICNYFCKKKLMPEMKFSIKAFNPQYIVKLVVVGIWNSLNKLQQILYSGLDLLLANLFISGSEMGILSLSKTIPNQISTLIGTVSSAFDPGMTIAYADEDKTEFLKQTKFAMCFCGFLCSVPIMGFIAFGKQFYSLWMPSLTQGEVMKIHILAILTMLPQIFSVYIYPLYNVNTITLKVRVPVLVSIGIGIVNITTVFILLKTTNLGVFAIAGVSSVLWFFRIFLFVPTYAAWNLHMPLKTFYPQLFKGVLNVAVLGTVMVILSMTVKVSSWAGLVVVCAFAAVAGYLISGAILFNKKDRKKAASLLKSKFKKGNSK